MVKTINNKIYDTDECLFIGREVDDAKVFFLTKDGEYLMVIPKTYKEGNWKKIEEEDGDDHVDEEEEDDDDSNFEPSEIEIPNCVI